MAADPSSNLPLSSQRDENAQRSRKRPDVKGLELPMQENIADDFDFTDSVLLSPPPLPDTFNILDAQTLSSPKQDTDSEQTRVQQSNQLAFRQNADSLSPSDVRARPAHGFLADLHIRTDIIVPAYPRTTRSESSDSLLRHSSSASSLPRRVPSVRDRLHTAAGSLSPGSVIASPQIAAMLDITPLPSPVGSGADSFRMLARSRSRGSSIGSNSAAQAFLSAQIPASSPPRRKAYHGLRPTPEDRPASQQSPKSREGTRSTSEYVPDSIAAPKPRPIVVSGSATQVENNGQIQAKMQREEFLGTQRGMIPTITKPPSPPPTVDEDVSGDDIEEPAAKRARTELYTVTSISDGKPRTYKSIKRLGQGTFSTVYLAVRQVASEDNNIDFNKQSVTMEGMKLRSQRLVAVKVVHHGPAGGADAERVEVSLQREVEIMKMTKHPSVVHLKAFSNTDGTRALLVMNYCPGGDLFEVASTNLPLLIPPLVRRIFAELVSAVRYLHQKYIVHRDIKLENVLLNIPIALHPNVPDWQTLDRAVVTLTDLGLSRRIPQPPDSPLLTTRCGSEDYAAPELLMGQAYDGRQTDAWALGVLLYSLMEGRLPFDPLPGARGDPAVLRARTPHRIARCEWAWWKFGDEDGEWDPEKGREFEGAFACVDGLLKRSSRRKGLAEIREMEWVRGGIDVDGGLRWVEEEAL